MLMGSQVKSHSLQNISGALQQRRVAAFSKTTEVAGDSFLNVENNQNENKMAPYSSSNDLEAQRSRADLKRGYLHTI